MQGLPEDALVKSILDNRGQKASFVLLETHHDWCGCDDDEYYASCIVRKEIGAYIVKDMYALKDTIRDDRHYYPSAILGQCLLVTGPDIGDEEMLLPFSYTYGDRWFLRYRREIAESDIEKIVIGTHILTPERERYSTFFDGYKAIGGDNIKFDDSNKGSEDKPWGIERFPRLERFGCWYDADRSAIMGDIRRIVENLIQIR
jgi:hypothetical protein